MGRPYATELLELDETYKWCIRTPISELAKSIASSANQPLIAVGSGGSLTSAHFAGFLHTSLTGQASQVFTPYELVTTSQHLVASSVLVCSAGGSNPDVLLATAFVIKRAPRNLFVITTRDRTPLQMQIESARWPRCHAFSTPVKKDGFLATNSLLATIVLLTRAYESWAGVASCLPSTLDALLHPDATRDTFVDQYRERILPLLMRETLIVLHGAATKPAAMDVESRLTEAALANVQLADFRNFAHGRHHWLARHSESSAVLAFAEERDEISRRTLSLIPSSIPRWQVSVEPGVRGALVAVYHSLLLAAIGGLTRGYDPGRPHVPAFGRKLYQLRVISKVHDAVERTNLAIERKAGMPVAALSFRRELDGWLKYYRAFIERLAKAQIRAIVLDYDGTLCAPDRRLEGPSPDVAIRLNSLIDAGVTVAVATGRGKSVREALCQLILPQHRERLIVGYHNGAEIATLADSTCPKEKRPVVQEFAILAVSLQHSSTICNHATVEAKGKQISLELLPAGNAAVVFDEAVRIVQKTGPTGISLVTSDHSVDIIAPGISKSNVVEEVIRRLDLAIGDAVSVLCIGDRGRAPGNDADLLRYPLSLSVDEVSSDFATCWNIAEPGLRFDSACFEYLTRLRPDRVGMRFDTKGMQP